MNTAKNPDTVKCAYCQCERKVKWMNSDNDYYYCPEHEIVVGQTATFVWANITVHKPERIYFHKFPTE